MSTKQANKNSWGIKPMPPNPIVLDFDIFVEKNLVPHLAKGFIPKEMEEKWFIYFENNKLFMHRSWTGFLVCVINFNEQPDGLRSDKIEINSRKDQFEFTDKARFLLTVENIVANLIVKNSK